jgi:hypothetical protein
MYTQSTAIHNTYFRVILSVACPSFCEVRVVHFVQLQVFLFFLFFFVWGEGGVRVMMSSQMLSICYLYICIYLQIRILVSNTMSISDNVCFTVTQWVPTAEKELITFTECLSSTPVMVGFVLLDRYCWTFQVCKYTAKSQTHVVYWILCM